jgi:hypothetical protein
MSPWRTDIEQTEARDYYGNGDPMLFQKTHESSVPSYSLCMQVATLKGRSVSQLLVSRLIVNKWPSLLSEVDSTDQALGNFTFPISAFTRT